MNGCEQNDISPLNHCHYCHNIWDGRFTYYKTGKQSQIDFCFSNRNGRKFVSNFQIIDRCYYLYHYRMSFMIILSYAKKSYGTN